MRPLACVLILAGCLEPELGIATSEVMGGSAAPAGKWPDVAAVNFAGQQGCTGTLIAPTVVLTAGHCNDPELDSVLVGTASLARAQDGEVIEVARRVPYESMPGAGDAFETMDLTVLVLARASRFEPRAIATGWARHDIRNGAQVTIAGYGGTNSSSTIYVAELQEAITTITDFDCSTSLGCNPPVQPAGELGAGGMGVDTCPGDSGGPLYLMTEYGNFLAGATSRAYDDATTACKDGGIYARPDKVVDWIEASAGVPVARGPAPAVDPIEVVRGNAAETQIRANDPRTSSHDFAIAVPPAHGAAKVRGDGRVRVCADPSFVGEDSMVVTVTDEDDSARMLEVRIPIAATDGVPAESCDVDDFEGGGCCDSGGRAGSSALVGLGLLMLVTRRRRR